MLDFFPAENVSNKDGFYVFKDLPFTDAQTATAYGVIFIAMKPCEIMMISEVHTVADAGAGARTMNIEKLTGTEALDAGVEVLVTDLSLKTTANTVVTMTGSQLQNTQLSVGDRLALKDISLFSVEGVQVTIYLKVLGKGDYR